MLLTGAGPDGSRPRRMPDGPVDSLPMHPAPEPLALPDAAVDAVIAWYHAAARDLPWRDGKTSPWGVLVSEIMLQQTPVARVLPRWQAWMRRWPEPADLAAAPTAEVIRAWDRLGYPRRALRLQECARAICARHGGQVPADEVALRALPGIGEYTAAAVGAFAHGRRTVVADTNIRRVLVRALTGRRLPAASYTAAERALVATSLPRDTARAVRWNQAVMELGALVCTARSPRCGACPLAQRGCEHLDRGLPADDGPARRTQGFEGTDRQLRGRIMAALRERDLVPLPDLMPLDPTDPERVARCAASLVADGLAARDGEALRLP